MSAKDYQFSEASRVALPVRWIVGVIATAALLGGAALAQRSTAEDVSALKAQVKERAEADAGQDVKLSRIEAQNEAILEGLRDVKAELKDMRSFRPARGER